MALLPLLPDLTLMQTRWKTLIDPLFSVSITNGLAIKNISLIVGSTSINHGLQRLQQGWYITDVNYGQAHPTQAANIYRSTAVPFNNQTLNLSSNAAVMISLWVF